MVDPASTAATAVSGPVFLEILKMVLDLGPIGLVLVIWYFGQQKTEEILRRYAEDMRTQREMYLANVSLVKRYEELAGDLKDVILLNTQAMTRLVDRIEKEVCR